MSSSGAELNTGIFGRKSGRIGIQGPELDHVATGIAGGIIIGASTVKVTLAGVVSVFPAASILRNETVCVALVSPVAVNPVGRHAVHAPASIRHS